MVHSGPLRYGKIRKRRFLDTHVEIKPFNLTEVEKLRIHRAFYRYQIYCNQYNIAKDQRLELDNVRDVFFEPMASWEVEEFACIVDNLNDKLAVLDEVAYHDLANPYRYRLAYSEGTSLLYVRKGS